MNILIVSANKERNHGDILIYESLKEGLESRGAKIDSINFRLQYLVASLDERNAKENNKYSIKEVIKQCKYLYLAAQTIYFIGRISTYYKLYKDQYKDCDKVIIGGGQLIMDSPKSILFGFNLLFHVSMARVFKKKVYFVGVGIAEHFNYKITKKIVRYCFGYADKVICRDIYSFQRALLYAPDATKVESSIDLAVLFNYEKYLITHHRTHIAGISTLAYYDKRYFPVENDTVFNKYKESLRKMMLYLDSNYDVYLLPTTKPDELVAFEVDSGSVVISNDYQDLIKHISGVDLFIATRMHSFIISIMLDVPVVCFEWDNKIKGFIASLCGFQVDNYLFNLSDLDSCAIIMKKIKGIEKDCLKISIDTMVERLNKQLDEITYN